MSKEETIEQRVTNIVVRQLNVSPAQVKLTASFYNDLAADSLDFVELIMALEDEFETELHGEIPELEIEKLQTVGHVVDYIQAKAG